MSIDHKVDIIVHEKLTYELIWQIHLYLRYFQLDILSANIQTLLMFDERLKLLQIILKVNPDIRSPKCQGIRSSLSRL